MKKEKSWSRRDFVQMMGAAAIGSHAMASTAFASPASAAGTAAFLYVGSETDTIEVLAAEAGQWKSIQRVESAQPVSLTVAEGGRTLYVVNQIGQYRGLPMGTVEAYAIGEDGRLTLRNRQELSLAATMPRHAAISPDGRNLMVTAHGGGVYNLLPIAADGSLGRAVGILKATGDEKGRTAQPHVAVFDKAGRAIGVEQGTGRLRVFAPNSAGLATHAVATAENEEDVQHVALHHKGNVLYVAQQRSLECYGYDHGSGSIDGLKQRVAHTGIADGAKTVAVHPSGHLLLACDKENGIAAWTIGADGRLQSARSYAKEMGRLASIEIAQDGRSLIAINREEGVVTAAALDEATGRVGKTQKLAKVDSPRSFAVVYS